MDIYDVGSGWAVERRTAWDYVGGCRGGSPVLGVEEGIMNPHSGTVFGPWSHKVSNFAIDGTETGFADFFEELGEFRLSDFPRPMPGCTPMRTALCTCRLSLRGLLVSISRWWWSCTPMTRLLRCR